LWIAAEGCAEDRGEDAGGRERRQRRDDEAAAAAATTTTPAFSARARVMWVAMK
jgi:hypothetical protein